jgi:nucleoside-diphosphate-sugar epimerase
MSHIGQSPALDFNPGKHSILVTGGGGFIGSLLVSNNRKAFKLLNWAPTTSLATGLRQTLEWLRGNLSGHGQFSL